MPIYKVTIKRDIFVEADNEGEVHRYSTELALQLAGIPVKAQDLTVTPSFDTALPEPDLILVGRTWESDRLRARIRRVVLGHNEICLDNTKEREILISALTKEMRK